ncbi:MAG: transaldolase family protein [Infirmifilum sp.]
MSGAEINYKAALKREALPEAPPVSDSVSLALYAALKGYPDLGADNLLNPALREKYAEVIGSVDRRAHLAMLRALNDGDNLRALRIYLLIGEMGLNTIGLEMHWAGVPLAERERAFEFILSEARELEKMEAEKLGGVGIASEVVRGYLEDMKKVMSSNPKTKSLVSWISDEASKHIDSNHPLSSFLSAMRRILEENAYYKMTLSGLCRFGNDYALGLRWLRRLGFVQVSTNPVLAAEAYKDDPSLWDNYLEYVQRHLELAENPGGNADLLAMTATLLVLIPNMEVLRPVAFLLDFKDGMVSYQLNPNVADSVEGSVSDALKIYTMAEEYFTRYDSYLLWGWPRSTEIGRPNLVFKVAGSSEASLAITRILESLGIGTNNTVTFSVSQEVSLILEKIAGRAAAVKRGVKPTKVYETNMGGRLEAHLREVKAAELIKTALTLYNDPERELFGLAKRLGVPVNEPTGSWLGPSGWGYDITASNLEEKVQLVASQAYIRSLVNEALVDFLAGAGVCGATKDEVRACLEAWERAISLSGTFIAQRVWHIFFEEENRRKWIGYIMRKYGLTPKQAEEVLDGIDVLPASKRRPNDTYYTLSSRNMTNTEFPNHQLNVHLEYKNGKVRLEEYREAISVLWGAEQLNLLLKMAEFRRAYELTSDLLERLREAGFRDVEAFGEGGLRVEEWPVFGPGVKTMRGFTEAYNRFRDECVQRLTAVRHRS